MTAKTMIVFACRLSGTHPLGHCCVRRATNFKDPSRVLHSAVNIVRSDRSVGGIAAGGARRTVPLKSYSSRGLSVSTTAQQNQNKGKGQDSQSEGAKWFGRLAFAIPAAYTLYLGTWQMNRYKWKVDLIESRNKAVAAAVIDNPSATTEAEWEEIHYRRVTLTGTYKHEDAFYVGPRSAPTGGTAGGGSGLVSAPGRETGFFLVTPFKVSKTGQTLLVNRGWVPRSLQGKLPPDALPKGEVLIVAVNRPVDKVGSLAMANNAAAGSWFSINPAEMGAHLGMENSPPFCELFEEEFKGAGAYPKKLRCGDLINFHVMPVTHLAYSATWYCMSVAITIGTYFRFK